MKIGAAVWPFKWDAPYEDALPRIAGLGFRCVELIAWNLDVLKNYYTPERVESLRSILDDEGLTVSQFIARPGDLASDDASVRAQAVENFKLFADTAVSLGSGIVNTVPEFPFCTPFPKLLDRPRMQMFTVEVPKGLDWDQNWRDYVDAVRACADYAGSVGIRYSIEPHPLRYSANVQGALRLLEAVDSPALGINFDPSHLFPVAEIPHVAILQLNKRIVHCHFSDNDGQTNAHWRPGMGKIDWGSVFSALKEVGYDGTISLEFEDVPGVSLGENHRPAGQQARPATAEFDTENEIALGFVTELARDAGFTLE